jgi:hypothetical protein
MVVKDQAGPLTLIAQAEDAVAGADQNTPEVPVLPYAQVIPAGIEARGSSLVLKAGIVLTPDPLGAPADSTYHLQSWPRDILNAVRAGLAGGEWTIPLTLAPAVYRRHGGGACSRPTPWNGDLSIPVNATATALKAAFDNPDDVAIVQSVWSRSIVGDKNPLQSQWTSLADRLEASLSGDATTAGKLATPLSNNSYQEPALGSDGQLTKAADGNANLTVDSVLAVPHADLAIALEFQRVEELLTSIKQTGEPGAKRRAEVLRLAAVAPRPLACELGQPQEDELVEIKRNRHKAVYDSLQSQRQEAQAIYNRESELHASEVCDSTNLAARFKDRGVFASSVDFEKAGDAHAYATWPQYSTPTDEPEVQVAPLSEADANAAQAFFAMQSTPSLARLFGLVIDVEVNLDQIRETSSEASSWLDSLVGSDGFLFLLTDLTAPPGSRTTRLHRALPWTLAKIRLAGLDTSVGDRAAHFWPASEEELWIDPGKPIVAENLAQFEGHVVMGSGHDLASASAQAARFDLTSMDVRSATELEAQRRQSRQANVDEAHRQANVDATKKTPECDLKQDPASAAYWADLECGATYHTSGLTLLDRGIQGQSVSKLAARVIKHDGAGLRAATDHDPRPQVVHDAEDLTMGVRLDVGVPVAGKHATAWHSLTSRKINFGTSGKHGAGRLFDAVLPKLTSGYGRDFRINLDSALQSAPGRLLPIGKDLQNVEVMMEEAFALWNGSPMGVDTSKAVDVDGNRYYSEDAFIFGRTVSLPGITDKALDRSYLPIPLRYGQPYRFKLRNVYLGGLSLAPGEAGDADERLNGKLFYPPASSPDHLPYFRFLRQHRIDRPIVLMEEETALRSNAPMSAENGPEMIVRSLSPDVSTATRKGLARPSSTRRIVIPPSVSLDEAARHGVFDRLEGDVAVPPGALRRVQHGDGGSFPVTATITRKGFNGVRHFISRQIEQVSASGKRDPDTEYGSPVLKMGKPSGQYYPDPSAEALAIGLRMPNQETYLSLGEGQAGQCITIGQKTNYTGLRPLLVEVVADRSLAGRARPRLGEIVETLGPGKLRSTGDQVEKVRLSLAPGESFEMDIWCVPSAATLAKEFSIVQSLAIYAAKAVHSSAVCTSANCVEGLKRLLDGPAGMELARRIEAAEKVTATGRVAGGTVPVTSYVGPGGAIVPPRETVIAIAEFLHDLLMVHPLPEICVKTTVLVEHATNKPAINPKLTPPPAAETIVTTVPRIADSHLSVLRPSTEKVTAAKILDSGYPRGLKERDSALDEGSTEFILDGQIGMPLDIADTFELIAKAVYPATARFDDQNRKRSLLRKREGSWPVYIDQAKNEKLRSGADIFGFGIQEDGRTMHEERDFTLLRVDHLPQRDAPPAAGKLDWLQLRNFFILDDGTIDLTDAPQGVQLGANSPAPKWRTVKRHQFRDGKARRLKITPRIISRASGRMDTMRRAELDILVPSEAPPLKDSYADGDTVDVIIPATVRPASCKALAPLQAFRWQKPARSEVGGDVVVTRKSVVRLPLGREWYSSGEDERVGLVVWPPGLKLGDAKELAKDRVPFTRQGADKRTYLNLYDFADDDLGPGGQYITRVGADPTTSPAQPWFKSSKVNKSRPGVFLPLEAFLDLNEPSTSPTRAEYADAVLMPAEDVPKGDDPPASDSKPVAKEDMLTVGLVHYEPLFDPEMEQWYIDVALEVSSLPDPFVRFGLVRYQPHTKPDLQVSRPVVQWSTILPWRTVRAMRRDKDIYVEVSGPTSKSEGGEFYDAPKMRFSLFVESANDGGPTYREPIKNAKFSIPDIASTIGLAPDLFEASTGRWYLLLQDVEANEENAKLVLYVEEIDYRRPSRYPAEPFDNTDFDPFVESGPRFAARLNLNELL